MHTQARGSRTHRVVVGVLTVCVGVVCVRGQGAEGESFAACRACTGDDEFEEMSIAEILTGKGEYFPGLIPLCYMYLEYIGCDRETFRKVSTYLEFIRRRGTGETLTTAAWIRKFVTSHAEYTHDSVVTPGIAYDLVMACKRIGEGRMQCPDLLGDVVIDPIFATEAYPVALSGDKLRISERSKLFAAYLNREPFHSSRPAHNPVPAADKDFFS
jgi:glutamate--cysteine ligase catalytic subunit